MMFGSKRGDSPIPLIIFTVATLLMGAATYNEYTEYQREQQNLDNLEAHKMPPGKDAELLERERKAYEEQITGLSNIMGFGFQIGGDVISVPTVKETLNKFKKEKDASNKIKYPSLYGRAEFADEEDIPSTLTLNLHVLLEALQTRLHSLEESNKILQSDIEKHQNYIDDENNQAEERKALLDERISKLSDEIEEINSRKVELVNKLEEEKNAAYNTTGEVKDKIDDERKKNKRVLSRLRSKLSSQRQEIRILIRQRKLGKRPEKISSEKTAKIFRLVYERPDGEIVYSDPATRITHINIGSRQNVVKGLKFMVFRYGEEHRIRYKGKVEVTRVDEDMSRVTILDEVDQYDPIITGDLLMNPIWDARNPRYIAFAGNNFGGRLSVQDMIRYCEDIGAEVELDENGQPMVTVRTNLLVAAGAGKAAALASSQGSGEGEDDYEDEDAPQQKKEEKKEFWWLEEDPNFKKAIEMGLEIIRDKDFLQYVGD